MTLTLHISTPGETINLEVDGSTTISKLKAETASLAGLDPLYITLFFEGEELVERKKVSDYPFEDQSEVTIETNKNKIAKDLLKTKGWREQAWATQLLASNPVDKEFHSILDTIHEGGLQWNAADTSKLLNGAIDKNLPDTTRYLALLGRDSKIVNEALLRAVLRDNLACMSALLPLIEESETRHTTHLCAAATKGNDAAISILLEFNADPNSGKPGMPTPLHLACQNKYDSCTRILLSSKADTSKQDADGMTPLHCAVKGSGGAVCAMLLVSNNADPNVKDKAGRTPVHYAAMSGSSSLEVLLAHGVDMNVQDERGNTPLHLCCTADCTKLLLEHNADPNIKNSNKETPLHAEHCRKPGLELLLQYNGNPNVPDNQGNTPLHKAAMRDASCVALLLEHGAIPNLVNRRKATPLSLAIVKKMDVCVNLLTPT
eukprot:TRINITY_DN3449_c0_g2_i3.p1 TRINITY_DN3449_c0_g2~~TRINITY_DN3449_c0_g2_i3.p1  ORF type:complete len:432 (+),score=92.58 TRINITY_DN3449_c0_g2_i3:60-1355(+)